MKPLDLVRRQPQAAVGATVLMTLVLMGVFASLLTSHSPSSLEFTPWLPPSSTHPLGTTALGQDIFAQLFYGARLSLLVGVAASLISTAIAVTVGLVSAYYGGRVDGGLSLATNVVLVLPGLPLLIVVSTFFSGQGIWPIILVIGLTSWAWSARILRSQALAVRGREFVQAAIATGERPARVIFAEMLPNLSGQIAARFFDIALYAVLSEAALSFIGIGDVGQVTWGTMLYWAQNSNALLRGAWWWIAAPGLCIALMGTAFALLNFGVDAISNPKLGAVQRKTRTRPVQPNVTPPIPSSQAVLDIQNLEAGYETPDGPVRAVRNVNLRIQAGEFFGLAGESGCGKSTLAFAATRLLEPPGKVFGGRVTLAGHDLLSLEPEALRRLRWKEFSLVFQASMNVLNPVLTIREQMYDALQAHGVTDRVRLEARAKELLGLIGVRLEYLGAYPHQLSGGMKQRVVIAIALALEPKLVFMDEPTTALDVVVQRQLLQEIDAVRRRLGLSIVFITHDLSLLVELCDRVAIMYAGEIVEEAPARALYTHPRHPYTQRLMNAFPPLSGPKERRDGIAGRPPPLGEHTSGCAFFERCSARIPGLCDQRKPTLNEIDPAHRVACFLHDSSLKEVNQVAHPVN
jgi:peptide/nickel transport system permease protein